MFVMYAESKARAGWGVAQAVDNGIPLPKM